MLFPVSTHTRVAEERLARLLEEEPGISSRTVERPQLKRDPARILVRLLLVTAVAGTWCAAYILG
jgi:hypothetical protein